MTNGTLKRWALVGYRAGSDAAAKGAMFVVTVAAARRLTQGDFGLFSLASTGGWMLAVATDFGIQLHVAREVAARPAEAGATFRRWLRLRAWLTVAGAAGAAIGAAVLLSDARDVAVVVLLAFAYLAASLAEFLYYVYRGLGRSDLESSLVLAHRGTLLVLAVGALAWRPDLLLLAGALLVPALLTLAAALRIALRVTGGSGHPLRAVTDAAGPPSRAAFAHQVAPIGIGIVLSALYFRIDLFFVAAWKGTAAAGLYNAVFRIVEALRLFPAALVAVALPAIFRARTRRPLVEVAGGLAVFGAIAAGAGMAGAGWAVPLLYGAQYGPAVPAFRVLMLSFPFMCLNYALTHQLVGWHGQRAYAVVCAAALIANVGLDVWLIPDAGMIGAAWATFWTEVVLTIGCAAGLRSVAPWTAPAVSPAS